MRRGDGRAEVLKVETIGENGRPTLVLRSGELAVVRVAVRFREAVADPVEREALYRKHLDALYARGKAINMGSVLEVDDVIDPADTRRWIMRGLRMAGGPKPRSGKRRPHVDTW